MASSSQDAPSAGTISRARGAFLTGAGLFLVILIGTVTFNLLPELLHPGTDVGGSRFDGTSEQAQMILILFAAIITFGLVGIAHGIFILRTGRKSLAFTVATLGGAAVLIIIAISVVRSLKGG